MCCVFECEHSTSTTVCFQKSYNTIYLQLNLLQTLLHIKVETDLLVYIPCFRMNFVFVYRSKTGWSHVCMFIQHSVHHRPKQSYSAKFSKVSDSTRRDGNIISVLSSGRKRAPKSESRRDDLPMQAALASVFAKRNNLSRQTNLNTLGRTVDSRFARSVLHVDDSESETEYGTTSSNKAMGSMSRTTRQNDTTRQNLLSRLDGLAHLTSDLLSSSDDDV